MKLKSVESGPVLEQNLTQQIETNLQELESQQTPVVGELVTIENNPDYSFVHLPPFYIPRSTKEQLALDRGVKLGGLELDSGRFLPLHASLLEIVKQRIREIREKYAGSRKDLALEQQKQADLRRLEQEVIAVLVPRIASEKKRAINGQPSLQFYTLLEKQKRSGASVEAAAEKPPTPAEMIDLSNLDFTQLVGITNLEEFVGTAVAEQPEETLVKVSKKVAGKSTSALLPNDLQRLRYNLGKPMKERTPEEWSAVVEDYIRLMDYMPQYLEHRLAVLDLFSRYQKGELKMPETILSVASGPYEEARAQMDFDYLYQELDLKQPQIINYDFVRDILVKGEAGYLDKAVKENKDDLVVPFQVQGDMRQLAFKTEAVDMVECSSLDNVINHQEDLDQSIAEIARVTKIGGIIRLTYKGQLPEKFYDFLEASGLKLLTARHTVFQLSKAKLTEIKRVYGDVFANKLKQKLSRKAEYIMAVKIAEQRAAPNLAAAVITELQTPSEPAAIEEVISVKTAEQELMDQTREAIRKKRAAVGNDIRLSLIRDAAAGLFFHNGEPLELDKHKINELISLTHLGSPQRLETIKRYQELPRYFRISLLQEEYFSGYQDLVLDGILGEDFAALPGIEKLAEKNYRAYEKLRLMFNQARKNDK